MSTFPSVKITHDFLRLCWCFFHLTICSLLTLVPESSMQNTHISKVIALFVSTTLWQSGGDVPYCKTVVTERWGAAKAAIWQVSCTISTCASSSFLSSPPLSLSASLRAELCLLASLSAHFPPFNLLSNHIIHLYLPVHPPPLGPDHTQTRRGVKIERGIKEEKQRISCAWWSAVFCFLLFSSFLSFVSIHVNYSLPVFRPSLFS